MILGLIKWYLKSAFYRGKGYTFYRRSFRGDVGTNFYGLHHRWKQSRVEVNQIREFLLCWKQKTVTWIMKYWLVNVGYMNFWNNDLWILMKELIPKEKVVLYRIIAFDSLHHPSNQVSDLIEQSRNWRLTRKTSMWLHMLFWGIYRLLNFRKSLQLQSELQNPSNPGNLVVS